MGEILLLLKVMRLSLLRGVGVLLVVEGLMDLLNDGINELYVFGLEY